MDLGRRADSVSRVLLTGGICPDLAGDFNSTNTQSQHAHLVIDSDLKKSQETNDYVLQRRGRTSTFSGGPNTDAIPGQKEGTPLDVQVSVLVPIPGATMGLLLTDTDIEQSLRSRRTIGDRSQCSCQCIECQWSVSTDCRAADGATILVNLTVGQCDSVLTSKSILAGDTPAPTGNRGRLIPARLATND